MAIRITTVQGENWDEVARRAWPGARQPELLLHRLVEANPEHVSVIVFSAGVELVVPEIELPADELDLPPWKRSE